MKILVIDDSSNHRQSAQQTLGTDHDLTVVGSHDEVMRFLGNQYDKEKQSGLQEQYEAEGMNSWDAYQKARDESQLPYWDVVLSDLLMPAGKAAQGGPGLQYVGVEMPVGWSLAITAAISGAKYVAVVTDMDHHHHPASAMLDSMNRNIFDINGAKALFTNYVSMVGIEGTEKTCEECVGSGKKSRDDGSTYECYTCRGTGTDYGRKGKDWAGILKQLMEGIDNSSSV